MKRQRHTILLCALVLLVLAGRSWAQVPVWRISLTLFAHAVL